MKWWHYIALGLGGYFLWKLLEGDSVVGEGGGPSGDVILAGPPKLTPSMPSDFIQKATVLFTQMYSCAKYDEPSTNCCASDLINIAVAANGAVTVYCMAVSKKTQPKVLVQYSSVSEMYNQIGYMLQ